MRRLQIAEAPGESEVVRGAQSLVAEQDHQMLEERLAHRRETQIVELRKIDAADFGADGGRDSADVENNSGHGDGELLGAAGRVTYFVHRATI